MQITTQPKNFLIAGKVTEVMPVLSMTERPIINSHRKLAKHHVEITQERIAKRNVTNKEFTKKFNSFAELN